MEIVISIKNRAEWFNIPVPPEKISFRNSDGEQTFETADYGTLNLIGELGLEEFSFSSFFPVKEYPFMKKTGSMIGWDYVNKLKAWRKMRVPIRVIAVEGGKTIVNMAVSLSGFDYAIEDGSGDINYSLVMTEYPIVKVG